MTIYITIDEVLALHEDQLLRYGGGSGIRDMGLLEAALYRPQTGYYDDIIGEAAALWESLAQNHPFVDGNKRTAFAVVFTFLYVNGFHIKVDGATIYAFIMELYEQKNFKRDVLETWLRNHSEAA